MTASEAQEHLKADEGLVAKLQSLAPKIPEAEIHKVAAGVMASGVKLDKEDLEMLLPRVSASIRVAQKREHETERRQQIRQCRRAALAAAEAGK
jgi:hypothetical protein